MHVYLDNAASTPLDDEVLDAMMPYLKGHYGNPSSIHSKGREGRAAIEKARKTIASLLNTSPSEILFTSGGTEADNTALQSAIRTKKIKQVISSPIEHHAVLHTLESFAKSGEINLTFVELDEKGLIDYDHLQWLISQHPGSMVSLMHANNELGNVYDIERIGNICKEHHCLFHSDTVQSMGHIAHDLQKTPVDFIVGSAHKFHGPKGVGFLYTNSATKIDPFIHGGAQERNQRGGTENLHGIVGMAKALEIAYANMAKDKEYIQGLKFAVADKLKAKFSDIQFNGDCLNKNSLYTVLNISLPESDDNEMLLFNLDIHKIYASGGSACSSGTSIGSHVLQFLNVNPRRGHIRFSFSKYNTMEEIDYVVEKLEKIFS